MQKLTFTATIRAPREVVWNTMLDDQTYREWTRVFCEGSYYEGSWDEGATIRFLSPSGDGMVATIARNEPHAFVSIEHRGMITNGVEDTTSEAVRSWTPAYENYRLETEGDATRVTVTLDMLEDYAQTMEDAWPKALDVLRGLCEKTTGR